MQSPSVLACCQFDAKAESVKARPVKVGPVKAGPVKTNARVNAKIERRVFMAFTPLAVDLKSVVIPPLREQVPGLDLTARREKSPVNHLME